MWYPDDASCWSPFRWTRQLRKDRTSLIVHRGEHSTKVFSTSGKIPGRMPRCREWHEGFFGSGEDSRENSGEKGFLWRYLSRILSGREYSWDNSRENASISKCHCSGKVTWHFAPLSDQRHTFVLTYRVLGVVQKASAVDLLNWEVLPTNYDYAIRSSTTTVRYPERAVLLGAPQVTRGAAQVTTSPGTVTFMAHDLSAGSLLEITLRFRAGSIIHAAPHWQQLQEQAQALIVPYLLGGLAIFLALFLLAFWHYRR